MKLRRVLLVAGLLFAAVSPASTPGQQARPSATVLRPFVTLALGPGIGQTVLNERGHKSAVVHPVLDLTAGARKRLFRNFGVVLSANAGRTFDTALGGEDLTCRIHIVDGKPSACLPNDPLLDWFGVSAGGEGYFGPAIVGLQFGPSSFGTRGYERDPFTGQTPGREIGLRSQLDVHFPLYRRVGVTLSAVRGSVPKIVDDRMRATSMSAGLTFRPFR